MKLAQKTFHQQNQIVCMYDKAMSDESILLDMTVFRRFVIHRSAFFLVHQDISKRQIEFKVDVYSKCVRVYDFPEFF